MTEYSKKQLQQLDKDEVIDLFLKTQADAKNLQERLFAISANIYGRKSEKMEVFGQQTIFNECEAIAEENPEEEETEEVSVVTKKKKTVGKRETDLSKLPKEIVSHELTDEELTSIYGENGWKCLPDEVYSNVLYIPSARLVKEHHIAVYVGKHEDKIVRAPHPAELFNNSIATPSLVAAIMNAKYTNGVPLYRLGQEFARGDLVISTATMSNWVIRSSERYLSLLFDKLQENLVLRKVVQADETTCEVTKDGRSAGTKSYMFVYRTSEFDALQPIVLFDYQKTRGHEHVIEFLKGFSGYLETDAFSGYHALDREQEEIQVANCWAHARRDFSDALKSYKGPNKQKMKKSLAYVALEKIGKIYAVEDELRSMTSEERLKHRQEVEKPLVEEYFAWVKEHMNEIVPGSQTAAGFNYSLAQEKYLRRFLENGDVPIDNSASERAIRPFTIGRKNWVLIDTIHGAQASAIVYSLVETAKANNLSPYLYLNHLLTEIPAHMNDTNTDFLEDLLPWSDKLPENIRKNPTEV